MGLENLVKIWSVTAETFLIWTNVSRTNVAWTNVIVKVGICERWSRNLPLKFGQNRVSNIQDIADIEFSVVGGRWCKVIFV